MSATNTIIIESNRQIAFRQAQESMQQTSVQDVVKVDRIPNNTWKTHLPAGLSVEVGDQLNLEAAMINSIGGGDSVMEFIGDNGTGGTDLQMQLMLSFYITNRMQFNFNLPKFGMKIKYEVYDNEFGAPDFAGESANPLPAPASNPSINQYNAFRNSYPTSGLEGYSTNYATPRVTTALPASTNPSFTEGGRTGITASPLRFYYSEAWAGFYHVPSIDNFAYEKFTKKVNVSVPRGFSTPAAIGERLTAQLHNRDGTAEQWSGSTVNAQLFNMNAQGKLLATSLPSCTDQSFITIPTSTGTLLYGRAQGGWNAAFKGETTTPGNAALTEGQNYIEAQGRAAFWSNLLSANPDECRACSTLMKLMTLPGLRGEITDDFVTNADGVRVEADSNYRKFTLETGDNLKYSVTQDGVTRKVGELGNRPCMTSDTHGQEAVSCTWFTSVGNTADASKTETIPCLKMLNYEVIPTNIIWNAITCNVVSDTFDAHHECAPGTGVINEDDPNYLLQWFVRWKIGRLDDEATHLSMGQKQLLTNPNLYSGRPVNGGSSSAVYRQYVWDGTGTPTADQSYYVKQARKPSASSETEGRPCLPGLVDGSNRNWDYEVLLKYYADPTWTPELAQENALNVRPAGLSPQDATAEHSTSHPGGLAKQQEVWAMMGNTGSTPRWGFIPVYRRIGGDVGESNFSPVPYMAFVTQAEIDPQRGKPIPMPRKGEPIGLSPSINDNMLAKPVNIQKKNNGSTAYPQATQTDTFDYYPFCHIGADDPLINFDGGYSRFTMSQFHTPIRAGNGTFNNPTFPENLQPETNVAGVSFKEACTSAALSNGATPQVMQTIPFSDIISFGTGNDIMSTQSGIAIERMFNFTKDLSSIIEIDAFQTTNFKNTLLFKLGFSLEQLLPLFGLTQNDFNRGNYNKYLGLDANVSDKMENMVKPFTTNAYVSAAIVPSLVKGTGYTQDSQSNQTPKAIPMPNLGGLGEDQATTNVESDLLIAAGMPQKLDYPYLVVYSDIVRNSVYYGGDSGHQKLSAIAYITRNYAEGDYFYAFSTSWSYTADQDYVITDITTDIRLPNGDPAPIDENSSVIYKVIKNKVMPLNPQIVMKINKEKGA